jgi:hypothetical protein
MEYPPVADAFLKMFGVSNNAVTWINESRGIFDVRVPRSFISDEENSQLEPNHFVSVGETK